MEYGIGHCECCGKTFVKYRPFQKYCSNKCREIVYEKKYRYVKKPMVKKICGNCGKEFETNDSKKKYCCVECCRIFQNSCYEPKEQGIRKCAVCGKEFTITHHAKKYCTDECYLVAKKVRETKNEAISRIKL